MLVAPAGYGKTTLAGQWLAEKPHGWYRGSIASSDVAAVVVGIARACSAVREGASDRVIERITATQYPEREVDILFRLLLEDIEPWPEDAWLAIDDYHYALGSAAAEDFVERLATESSVRLLLTSRARPSWASARKLLYGEFSEIGAASLALTPDEGDAVLSHRLTNGASGLVALADGWPAVIGLAALTDIGEMPDHGLPADLYDYFAQELFDRATQKTQVGLARLAFLPTASESVVADVLGDEGAEIVKEAAELGFFAATDRAELHPLLRAFLQQKVVGATGGEAAAHDAFEAALRAKRWDDAFEIADLAKRREWLSTLLDLSTNDLLTAGRLATISRWVAIAHGHGGGASVDLADAEVAFRKGLHKRAEVIALHAAREAGPEDAVYSRLMFLAGRAAHLDDREEIALEHFTASRQFASNDREARSALWGQIIAAKEVGVDTEELRRELAAVAADDPTDALRLANAQLVVATREGWIDQALEEFGSAEHLVDVVADPMIRTSFLNGYARALALNGRYDDAARVGQRELDEADRYALPFVRPHALVALAMASAGGRRYRRALSLLDEAEDAARACNDAHSFFEVNAVRCRILAARGSFDAALAKSVISNHRRPSDLMFAEYLASRAIALAARGDTSEAADLAKEALSLTVAAEAGVLTACALAVCALHDQTPTAGTAVREAVESAVRTGHVDSFITTYRAHPKTLEAASRLEDVRDSLMAIIERSGDFELARDRGLPVETNPLRATPGILSPREREVHALLVRGLTNREIARQLYISEATTKVHVRRVLAKLGARSRTEAAVLGLTD